MSNENAGTLLRFYIGIPTANCRNIQAELSGLVGDILQVPRLLSFQREFFSDDFTPLKVDSYEICSFINGASSHSSIFGYWVDRQGITQRVDDHTEVIEFLLEETVEKPSITMILLNVVFPILFLAQEDRILMTISSSSSRQMSCLARLAGDRSSEVSQAPSTFPQKNDTSDNPFLKLKTEKDRVMDAFQFLSSVLESLSWRNKKYEFKTGLSREAQRRINDGCGTEICEGTLAWKLKWDRLENEKYLLFQQNETEGNWFYFVNPHGGEDNSLPELSDLPPELRFDACLERSTEGKREFGKISQSTFESKTAFRRKGSADIHAPLVRSWLYVNSLSWWMFWDDGLDGEAPEIGPQLVPKTRTGIFTRGEGGYIDNVTKGLREQLDWWEIWVNKESNFSRIFPDEQSIGGPVKNGVLWLAFIHDYLSLQHFNDNPELCTPHPERIRETNPKSQTKLYFVRYARFLGVRWENFGLQEVDLQSWENYSSDKKPTLSPKTWQSYLEILATVDPTTFPDHHLLDSWRFLFKLNDQRVPSADHWIEYRRDWLKMTPQSKMWCGVKLLKKMAIFESNEYNFEKSINRLVVLGLEEQTEREIPFLSALLHELRPYYPKRPRAVK